LLGTPPPLEGVGVKVRGVIFAEDLSFGHDDGRGVMLAVGDVVTRAVSPSLEVCLRREAEEIYPTVAYLRHCGASTASLFYAVVRSTYCVAPPAPCPHSCGACWGWAPRLPSRHRIGTFTSASIVCRSSISSRSCRATNQQPPTHFKLCGPGFTILQMPPIYHRERTNSSVQPLTSLGADYTRRLPSFPLVIVHQTRPAHQTFDRFRLFGRPDDLGDVAILRAFPMFSRGLMRGFAAK